MAVAHDATSSVAAFSASGGPSWSHTVGAGANRALYVMVGHWTNTPGTSVTGVTWNPGASTALTLVKRTLNQNGTIAEIWRLLNPTSGTGTITVTFAATADGDAGAQSFSGVDQTTPEGTAVEARGTGTAVTVSPAGGVTGDMALDAVSYDGAQTLTMTANANRTQIFNAKSGQGGAASRWVDPANPQAMAWTLSVAVDWAEAAVVVKQVAAGGGGGLPFFIQQELLTGGMQELERW